MNCVLNSAGSSAFRKFPFDHSELIGNQIFLRTQRRVNKLTQVFDGGDIGRCNSGGSITHGQPRCSGERTHRLPFRQSGSRPPSHLLSRHSAGSARSLSSIFRGNTQFARPLSSLPMAGLRDWCEPGSRCGRLRRYRRYESKSVPRPETALQPAGHVDTRQPYHLPQDDLTVRLGLDF